MDDLNFDILSLNVRGLGDHKKGEIYSITLRSTSHAKGLFFYKKPTVCKRMNRYGQISLVMVRVLCSFRMENQTVEEF